MSITVDLSPAEMDIVRKEAENQNISVEDFSREAIMKQAGNLAYMARIKQAWKNVEEGKCTYLTDDELRNIVYGN